MKRGLYLSLLLCIMLAGIAWTAFAEPEEVISAPVDAPVEECVGFLGMELSEAGESELPVAQAEQELPTGSPDAQAERQVMATTEINGFVIDNSTVPTLKKYTGSGRNITIPDGVKTIDLGAFRDCKIIESVVIPESCANISWYAFDNCENLKSVTILGPVTTIGECAFRDCVNLQEVFFPETSGKIYIDSEAFQNCAALSNLYTPGGVDASSRAFDGCASLESVKICDSITYINSWAFRGCTGLKRVVIPDSVKDIGDYAFAYCQNLEEVIFPPSLKRMRAAVFEGCSSLKTISLPEISSSSLYSVFRFCTALENVELPKNLTGLGGHTFEGCSALKHISLPDTVTYIGPGTFRNCVNLEYVVIPEKATVYKDDGTEGSMAFDGCIRLKGLGVYEDSSAKTFAINYSIPYDIIPKPVGNLADAVVTLSETRMAYTGSAKRPEATVTHNGKTLKRGTDYIVAYANNKEIGTAVVTLTGQFDYEGTATATFSIVPGTPSLSVDDLTNGTVNARASSVLGATGYELCWKKQDALKESVKRTENGVFVLGGLASKKKYTFRVRAYATASGERVYGDYSESIIISHDISDGQLTIASGKYVFSGKAIRPMVKVKLGKTVLKKNIDYKLTWSKNVNAGTATVTAKGVGRYWGKLKGTFEIKRAKLTADNVVLSHTSRTYTGKAINPSARVTFNRKALKKNTDYTVSYTNNLDIGTATAVVKGKGNYRGTVNARFEIKPLKLSDCTVTLPDGTECAYTGQAVEPKIVVKNGNTIIPFNDKTYTVTYTNNTEIGTATAYVEGIGNLTGNATLSFSIVRKYQKPFKGNIRVTENFGHYLKWMDERTNRGYHTAVDLVCEDDPRVFPFANGTVAYKGYSSGNGYHIIIKHIIDGQTVYSLYSHLQNDSTYTDIKVDQEVSYDTEIGTMGSTGNSTGPHLHFSIFSGYSNNPYGYASKRDGENVMTHGKYTFYNPLYVIEHGKLP